MAHTKDEWEVAGRGAGEGIAVFGERISLGKRAPGGEEAGCVQN